MNKNLHMDQFFYSKINLLYHSNILVHMKLIFLNFRLKPIINLLILSYPCAVISFHVSVRSCWFTIVDQLLSVHNYLFVIVDSQLSMRCYQFAIVGPQLHIRNCRSAIVIISQWSILRKKNTTVSHFIKFTKCCQINQYPALI